MSGPRSPAGRPVLSGLAGSVALLCLALVPTFAGASEQPGLTLSPSRAEGTIAKGISVGPFGFYNTTSQRFQVEVLPVLLTQRRDGGVTAKDDAGSLTRARRYLRPQTHGFRLDPGERRDVGGTVTRVPKQGGLYGGLLFQATPNGRQPQITQVLRLNASVLLDPPAEQRRVALTAGQISADQKEGGGPIDLAVATTNRGNVYAPADASIRVIDPKGKTEATLSSKSLKILPDATVDLPATLKKRLPAATYRLRATVNMGGETATSSGRMVLSEPGQLEFRGASLVSLPTPHAERGRPVDVSATFRNTGNVPFAPQANVLVEPIRHGVVQKPISTQSVDVDQADPGDEGSISGSVNLPGHAHAYQLELRLLDGKRPLDSRSVSVTPQPGVGLGTRITDWITGNAVWLVGALAGLVLLVAFAAVYFGRPRRPVAQPGDGPAQGTTAGRPSEPPPARAPGGLRPFEIPAPANGSGARISLSSATYEELRSVGMSMTQANRVLRYREQHGAFSSVDELGAVGGMPQRLLDEVKRRAAV